MDTETLVFLIGAVGFLLQGGLVVGGAVWAVGQIKSAGDSLRTTISHHSDAIVRLEAVLEKLNDMTHSHTERIVRLEEQVKQ